MTVLSRRAVLAVPASVLSGCGFRPLYAPIGRGAAVVPELQAIYVAVMPERDGQLLRQALQRRFEGSGSGVAKRYELTGGMFVVQEGIGILTDNSVTYVRMNGNATWSLRRLDPAGTVLTEGRARAMDGMNILNQQFFAADLETAAVHRRLAEVLADQITLDVASFFRKRLDTAV